MKNIKGVPYNQQNILNSFISLFEKKSLYQILNFIWNNLTLQHGVSCKKKKCESVEALG